MAPLVRLLNSLLLLATSGLLSKTTSARRYERRDAASTSRSSLPHTTSPVVGILAQPNSFSNDTSHQYIAASYVKWLEVGGARSVPIPYDAPPALLDDLLSQINGLLLPGGGAPLPPSVSYLLDRIVDGNNQGKYFPVWGTCLGFEFLVSYVGGEGAMESGFKAENVSLPLELVHIKELYQDPFIFQTVQTKNVTMNNHKKAIEPDHFLSNDRLRLLWDITSINHDKSGRPFVSTIEPVDPDRFPFYGVQYHPEKNAFEFATYPSTNIPFEAIDHSDEGVAFSAYMARFFVQLVRRGLRDNPFHEYTKPDVYPVIGTYPMHSGLGFEQIYILPSASFWSSDSTTDTAFLRANA